MLSVPTIVRTDDGDSDDEVDDSDSGSTLCGYNDGADDMSLASSTTVVVVDDANREPSLLSESEGEFV